MRGNLGIVKEKPTRKTCFSRETKRLAHASPLQNFASRHFFEANEVSFVLSTRIRAEKFTA